MIEYFKIQTLKNEMEETYQEAIEMYSFIVKWYKSPKDWQRALEYAIEINNYLDYISRTSKSAKRERKNPTSMNIYLETTQEYNKKSKIAITALFEIVLKLGGDL